MKHTLKSKLMPKVIIYLPEDISKIKTFKGKGYLNLQNCAKNCLIAMAWQKHAA